MESQLTILFENPFWVGIYERIDGDCYQVCKITFGAEPSDREVYEFLLRNWAVLRFSQPTRTGKVKEKSKNPKRRQREIRSQLQKTGVGTKAQQALNQKRERNIKDIEWRPAHSAFTSRFVSSCCASRKNVARNRAVLTAKPAMPPASMSSLWLEFMPTIISA